MKYRKLRIAWSILWGILCLLLIALWVRSYWQFDDVSWGILDGRGYKLISRKGELFACRYPLSEGSVGVGLRHGAGPIDFGRPPLSKGITPTNRWRGFAAGQFGGTQDPAYYFVLPIWFIAGVTAAACFVPWIRSRYSLRTLLVGMTVAAIGLGLAIYAIRE